MKPPLPQNLDAERAVLGSVMIEPERFAAVRPLIPTPAVFMDEKHAQLWMVLCDVVDSGREIDSAFIQPEAERRGWWSRWPGFDFLAGLVAGTPAPARAEQYAAEIAGVYRHRLAYLAAGRLLTRLAGNGQVGAPSVDQVLLDVAGELAALADPDGLSARDTVAVTRVLADVEPEDVSWLWPGRVARGKLCLLSGDPGLGKSFLTLDLAARLSTGSPWPDDADVVRRPPAGTVVLTAEDDLADTVRPRLDAARADCKRIVAIESVRCVDGNGRRKERTFNLGADLPALEQAIVDVPECQLVIVDPISAFVLPTSASAVSRNSEVRVALAPLAALAQKHRVAVMMVTHLRKSDGSAIHRSIDSIAFIAASRVAWGVAPDRADTSRQRKLMLCLKNNLAPDRGGLAFGIVPIGKTAAVSWELGAVITSADDAMSVRHGKPGPEGVELSEAQAWLAAALADGPRAAKELIDEAVHGVGLSKRTVDRARRALNVVSKRDAPLGRWWWSLPGRERQPDCQVPTRHQKRGDLGNVEKTSGETGFVEGPESQVAKFPGTGGEGPGGERIPRELLVLPSRAEYIT